ncbi:MAG: hypothetical protein HYT20_00220 [Candidatus Nealsonbacteria bacterium]|nr:hypothetical protein [Candidatus Nealsonbacteria bacterium]
MRQLGYHPHETERERAGESSFARRLGAADYPRFHAYVSRGASEQEVIINIHLDQKKPVYKGTSAHSGEYDGDLVEREAERIKQMST